MSITSPTARTGPNPWFIATVAGMASYLDAATIVSTGNALVMYQEPLGITGNQIGIISAALTLGIAVGASVGGRLADHASWRWLLRRGRRRGSTTTQRWR